jgi:CheY-like chemotaxis protein
MSAARRLVIIDDDPEIVSALRSTFTFPDFVVDAFADPREALLKLHDLAPDLILCSLDTRQLPGRTVLRVVKRSNRLREVPFVFLCSDPTREDEVDSLEDGADGFFPKPVDVPVLVSRLRALLRLMGRLARPEERADAVAGSVGSAGALRLLRFCEDFRLTGRLTLQAPAAVHWAEFSGGELVRAGREPAEPDADPLDALLAVREGSYRIEQNRIDTRALAEAERGTPGEPSSETQATGGAGPGGAVVPGGRLSMVKSRGGDLQIQTEAENRPHLSITTVVVRRGQVLRRIESAWQHPLRRGEQEPLARRQVDEQHDRVVASLREKAQDARGAQGADGALLAWALERLAERAGRLLGATACAALLRRAHRTAGSGNPGLAAFEVLDPGRVSFDPAGGVLVSSLTVAGVADWITCFLAEAVAMRPEVAEIDLRETTRGAGDDLERCGLYAALGEPPASPS